MKSLKIIIACLFISSSYALEIDEKLTLRIVKTSDTKKTVLINRGQEDGLAKGDHAKFYLSVGCRTRGCYKGFPNSFCLGLIPSCKR